MVKFNPTRKSLPQGPVMDPNLNRGRTIPGRDLGGDRIVEHVEREGMPLAQTMGGTQTSGSQSPQNGTGYIPGSGDIYSILAALELERSQLAGKRLERQAGHMKADNALQKKLNEIEEKLATYKSAGTIEPEELMEFMNGTEDSKGLNTLLQELKDEFGITLDLEKEIKTTFTYDEIMSGDVPFHLEDGKIDTYHERNKDMFKSLETALENKIAEISDREDERNITISRYQNQMSRSMQGSAARQQAGQQLFSAIFNRI